MYLKFALAALVAILTAGCGSTDYDMMLVRFAPVAEPAPTALMAVMSKHDGGYQYICTTDKGEYRIVTTGNTIVQFQLLVVHSDSGAEEYQTLETVRVYRDGFVDISVDSPKPHLRVLVAERSIVLDEAQRVGGNLLTCRQTFQ